MLSLRLLHAMMKEEYRLHQSLVGPMGSSLFPATIFVFTAFLALVVPRVLSHMPTGTILLMLHAASVLYGLFVGGFGSIGEHVMTRRLGQVSMIMQMPQTYPVSFRRMMAVFYAKDTVFYLLYSYVPLTLGLAVAAPGAGVSLGGVAMLGLTTFLSFMVGMGLSFTLSAVSVRSRPVWLLLNAAVAVVAALVYPLGLLSPEQIILPLAYWADRSAWTLVASSVAAVALASAGVALMKERYETRESRSGFSFLDSESLFGFTGGLRTLVAKEWAEVRRTGALGPVVMSFAGHLLAIYGMSWVFEAGVGVSLGFNVVFYSGFVGFMGVMTYSFLTNLEHNEYLNVQPVSVDMVVKAKLVLYFIVTGGVSAAYVVGIGVLKGQLHLVPLGLLLAAATSVYVVGVTCYLTGLWTNTMFFDARVILKFCAAVVPPMIVAEIAALLTPVWPAQATQVVVAVSLLLLLASAPLLRRMERRWSGASFSFINAYG
ncbi:MAG TPA: hypothetical protein VGB32_06985 [Candidatus Bathyarchaeia archaeon]